MNPPVHPAGGSFAGLTCGQYYALMIDPASPSQEGFCARCGYSLRGLPEPRCPECGRPFDPSSRETFLTGRQRWLLGPTARRLLAPPTYRLHIACALASLMVLYGYSVPGLILPVAHAGFSCWLIVMAVWAGRLSLSIGIELLYRPPFSCSRISWRWFAAPLLVLFTALLCICRVPTYVVFAASKPSLDALAAEAVSTPFSQPLTQTWVGVYPVKRIRRINGGVRIGIRGSYGLGGGFAWFPQGPPVTREYIYTRIWDAWYAWYDSGWANQPLAFDALFRTTY